MKLLIIDGKKAFLKTNANSIKVDDKTIPFHLIESVLIFSKLDISTSDIIKMTDVGLDVILISYDFQKSSLITSAFSKTNELKIKQYEAYKNKSLQIAKYILSNKISSHIKQLKQHQIEYEYKEYLQKIDDAKDLETLLGIEGSFSKVYFKEFFSLFPKVLHKAKRSKRPPLDPVNAMLSFYYMIFYNIIALKLIGYGFESGIGFLHKPFRSHQALSSDILEFFRADINEHVYNLFSNRIIWLEDFSRKKGVYLRYEGRKKIWKIVKDFLNENEYKINSTISSIRKML